jgi:predicted metal-dependent phosphoesterase TrpH
MAVMDGLADLHSHTTASDGLQAPSDNVRLAKELGLAAVAITDHDTVAGVEEALAAGERLGIIVVPGVEISTAAEGVEVHILGYYTDNANSLWLKRLAGQRDTRQARNKLILDRLRELGMNITEEELVTAMDEDKTGKPAGEASIGRPHIAAALIRKGYVSSMQEAFERYLAAGAAAYVNPPRPHPLEAIRWISEAGGTSVIAHPGLYGNDALVEELIVQGAEGIEVFHSDHGAAEEQRYTELAKKYGIIITGGSDFHGIREGEPFHGALGSRTVGVDTLARLGRSAPQA